MQVKKLKWCDAAVLVALISFLLAGQKVYSQEPDSGFPPPREGPVKKNSFEKETSGEIAEKENRWMKKKLKLKKEQLPRVKAINAVYAFKRKDYEMTSGPGDDGNKQKIMDKLVLLDKEKDDELRKVFTEKQYSLYLKKKQDLIEKIRSDGNENEMSPASPPDGGF